MDVCPWNVVHFPEQIMPMDKYLSIFWDQVEAIVYLQDNAD